MTSEQDLIDMLDELLEEVWECKIVCVNRLLRKSKLYPIIG